MFLGVGWWWLRLKSCFENTFYGDLIVVFLDNSCEIIVRANGGKM